MSEIDNLELQNWVEKAQKRDGEAFREIFELMSGELFSYALSHIKSREDALDVVQETFIDLWGALKKFSYHSRQEFYGFVYVILKRRLYKHYKKSDQSVEFTERHIVDNYEIEVEDYRYLNKFVKALPARYQELLRLRYWSSLTYHEISLYMNIKETTAKVWHHRAIKKLQEVAEKLA